MTAPTINYLEIPSTDLTATKRFFSAVFSFEFTDYGPDYVAFAEAPIGGGFFRSEQVSNTANGAALIVFYSAELEATLAKVTEFGGNIIKPIFSFPGGRRFHFTEPGGSEFAVWSE